VGFLHVSLPPQKCTFLCTGPYVSGHMWALCGILRMFNPVFGGLVPAIVFEVRAHW